MSVTDIARVLVTIGVLGLVNVSPAQPQTPAEPAEVKASPAVQKLLDEATTHASAKRPAEALATADRALVAAQVEKDGAGEAQAQKLRAQALTALNRGEEALSAWEAAAARGRAEETVRARSRRWLPWPCSSTSNSPTKPPARGPRP